MSDTQQLIGTPVPDGVTYRDAIHIAVVPLIALGDLNAGVRVDIVEGKYARASAYEGDSSDGVVDPFLAPTQGRWGMERGAKAGSRVWVFLNPGSSTGLRHEYAHPKLDAAQPADPDAALASDPMFALA